MPTAFFRWSRPWTAQRIVAEDQDIIVVDKPRGLSTQSSEAPNASDLVRRLRAFLADRDNTPAEGIYLGVQQPLERDISGVILLSKRKPANAALAPQFERGTVERAYVAVVEPWPARLPRAGSMTGTSDARNESRRVTLRYNVTDRRAGRAMLELTPSSGGATAVRSVLAQRGCPVVGDSLREGSPAHRVMLHAQAITVDHPSTRARRAYTADTPAVLRLALEEDTAMRERNRIDTLLIESLEQRSLLFCDADTDAFRLANDTGDGLSGFTLDRYGDFALAQFYNDGTAADRQTTLDAAASIGATGLYVKFRPRQANTLVDTRRDDLAPAHAVRGADAPTEFPIRELGLAYLVRLGDGLSTGIFLDQRENRRRVREMARGARVLNLFAYTCAFTVAAAAGGAKQTVSVDLSPSALEWGKRNLGTNALSGPEHDAVSAEAFGWLEGARARREHFDLVLLDPPSYSTSKDGVRFSAETDYRALAERALSVVAPGGSLIACTNHRGIGRAKLRRHLREAAGAAGREVAQMLDLPDPADFPAAPGHEPHLKSILVHIAGRAKSGRDRGEP